MSDHAGKVSNKFFIDLKHVLRGFFLNSDLTVHYVVSSQAYYCDHST
jgi:hypothetical protein